MITYLTQLLTLPIVGQDGTKAGRILDALAEQGGRLPTLVALYIKGKEAEGWVRLENATISDTGVILKGNLSSLTTHQPGEGDLRLQRDILDKQIVDVHDYRVVRANDVRIAQFGESYCLVGADVSLRAIIRRIPGGGVIEKLAKVVKRPLHSRLIAWDDVETLEPGAAGGGRIKLKVSAEKIGRMHPADIADIVEQLDPQRRAQVIGDLDVETAADTIEEMEEEEAAEVMQSLDEERAADILDEMQPDAAADLLADLSDEKSEDLLEAMEPEEAAEVKELLSYGEESAGGLMTTDFIAIPSKMTCDQTIQHLRKLAPKAETIYYVYVVDDEERLVGIISLRDLIVSEPDTNISDIMADTVRYVFTSDHADDVARLVNKYNLLAMPVVDDEHKLAGIINVDDVMELLSGPDRRRKLPQVTIEED